MVSPDNSNIPNYFLTCLIERIKGKYTFAFDKIYEAKTSRYEFNEYRNRKNVYVQVHKHFPDPNFEDPFGDPYKAVSTKHVSDHLCQRYFYYDDDTDDDEKDELWIKLHDDREISLGSCKQMLKKDLSTLIEEYGAAIKDYEEAINWQRWLIDRSTEVLHERWCLER